MQAIEASVFFTSVVVSNYEYYVRELSMDGRTFVGIANWFIF